ncbi:hypothetical protein ACFV3R_24955 [Streptomyces sp. NPDC059740]|uniref:hypothetical protein n=1 Tax=Streptomyces sp. NPDC059740 TaxID=3346926 RepID=UPI00366148A3
MTTTVQAPVEANRDTRQCAQCGRIGVIKFLPVTNNSGGPDIYVCQGRVACRRRVHMAQQTLAARHELQALPAPAEDTPLGVKDWVAPTGWSEAEQEQHYRELALAIGIDPDAKEAHHPRVIARRRARELRHTAA